MSSTMWEFKSFVYPLPPRLGAGLPMTAGAVSYDEAGNATLLHFAPGRFLAPAAGEAVQGFLRESAARGEGALFEVTGKWQRLSIPACEEAILAATFDVSQVLSGRNCAAATVFDCPSVVARGSAGFAIWVATSYYRHLCGLIDQSREQMRASVL